MALWELRWGIVGAQVRYMYYLPFLLFYIDRAYYTMGSEVLFKRKWRYWEKYIVSCYSVWNGTWFMSRDACVYLMICSMQERIL